MSARSAFLKPFLGTFLVLGVMIVASLAAAFARAAAPGHVLFATAVLWAVADPLLLLVGSRILDISHDAMGVRPSPTAPRRPRYILGVLGGLALVLLPAVIGRVAGGYAPMPSAELATLAASGTPTGSAALGAVVFALPALMIAALGEELLFRGVLLRLWQPLMGPRGALVLSSALFVAVHVGNPGATARGAVGVMLAGILLGAVFLARGDLWTVAGAHLGWNAGEALIVGVPVSGFTLPSIARWQVVPGDLWQGLLGGTFGPEEGLLYHGALGLAAGTALVLATAAGGFLPGKGTEPPG